MAVLQRVKSHNLVTERDYQRPNGNSLRNLNEIFVSFVRNNNFTNAPENGMTNGNTGKTYLIHRGFD
jgi:hypothetical protein